MNARPLWSLALLTLMAAGCNAPSAPANAPGDYAETPRAESVPSTGLDSAPNQPASDGPRSTADAGQALAGNVPFALDLYARLREKNSGNLFFSPASISTALAMTYAGAKGQTADEMARALRFDAPPEQLHAAFEALLRVLRADRPGCQVSVVNQLWGQQGYRLLPEFLQTTGTRYGAELVELDFARSEEARQTINRWVAEQTRGKIEDLIPPDTLNASARLVLTNAIYFKGDWASKFMAEATQDAPFHMGDNKRVDAPLMFQQGLFSHATADGLQVLELPYAGGDLSMLVLLPDNPDGLADLEQRLTAENLSQWTADLLPNEVLVYLPKFRLSGEFELADALHALGMVAAFDPARADFSGISGSRELFLSAAIHKAFVDVNEEGTEAAAATAIVGMTGAAPTIHEFRADHPFAFLIRDNATGGLLFAGRVVAPGGE